MLSELLAGVADVATDVKVGGLALDSRRVKEGDLFIALSGTQTQGHLYIEAAINAGAVAVLFDSSVASQVASLAVPAIAINDLTHTVGSIAERFFGEPSRELFIVGVTGTNGKTSCSHFLAQALQDDSRHAAVIGTLGNGLIDRLATASHTTPDAVTLHGMMHDLLNQGTQSLVMEVSSHGLEQGRVSGVNFDVAVFTNLSRDHLDYHGDMASYGQAKARLFDLPGLRYAVINGDDEFGCELLATMPASVETVVYSLGDAQFEQPCLRGEIAHLGRDGMTLKVAGPWGESILHAKLLGRFNASNLLAVLATLLLKGMVLDDAIAKLAQLQTVPGRVERFGGEGKQPLVVVDYAHTPDALQQVLVTLREHCAAQLWCVFGCGGDRDKGKRPEMGAIAAEFADQIVVTDDNPRHEDADAIVSDIMSGIDVDHVVVMRDRAAAIKHAVQSAGSGDVVLVAGKGHEDYQQVGDKRLPFSDVAQVQQALAVAA